MKFVSKFFVVLVASLSMVALQATAQNTNEDASREVSTEQQEEAKEKGAKEKIEQPDSLPPFDENAPMMQSTGERKRYFIRKVNIRGVKHLNEGMVRSAAGLIPGDTIFLPSTFISNSISRLWNQRYFSDVKVGATIDGDSVDIELILQERPVYIAGTSVARVSLAARPTTCARSWLCAPTPSSRTM